AANTGHHQTVGSGVVVGEATCKMRRWRSPEFKAESDVDCELGKNLPLILDIGEHGGLTRGREEVGDVPANRIWFIQKKTGERIGETFAWIAVQSGRSSRKVKESTRTKRQILNIVVTHSADINSPLDCMVRCGFCPVANERETGFGLFPGQ